MTPHRDGPTQQPGPSLVAGLADRPSADLAPSQRPSWLSPKPSPTLHAPGLSGSLGSSGGLEVRLAETPKEVRRAQRLRYKVFFEEMSAVPSPFARLSRRDTDAYDPLCEHLVVLDHAAKRKPFRTHKPKVVGTYRLLRREIADAHFGFYSASEFDLDPLLAAHPGANLVELGRSCVLAPYRSKKTVELLWQGILAYVIRHRVDALVGCASLDGTDLRRLALPLSYLNHFARAPASWTVSALPGRYQSMDLISPEAIDARAAFKALPPLVKGYLRCGATFGDGAVVDHRFGTTDVFAVMPVPAIRSRYVEHFSQTANRIAA